MVYLWWGWYCWRKWSTWIGGGRCVLSDSKVQQSAISNHQSVLSYLNHTISWMGNGNSDLTFLLWAKTQKAGNVAFTISLVWVWPFEYSNGQLYTFLCFYNIIILSFSLFHLHLSLSYLFCAIFIFG